MTGVPAQLHLSEMRARFVRVPSLDGFRAVSVLVVMTSHFVASDLFPGGFGVLVFFVVSGFLITRLLFAEFGSEGRVSLGNFYLRRFFRLYPVIVVYTAAVIAFCAATGQRIDWLQPASALFYFANYLYPQLEPGSHEHTMPFGIFWSLSVEEHFYFVFPLLFVALRGAPGAVARAMLWTIAVCIGSRLLLAWLRPDLLGSLWFYCTELRLDSIGFGVLLAALCESERGRRFVARLGAPAPGAAAFAVLLACFLVRNPWFRETWRYSLQGAGVATILAATLFSPRYRPVQILFNIAQIRWIGVLSYSLYVWHGLAAILARAVAPNLTLVEEAFAAFALAFVLAIISYYWLERPAMRLRHRFGSRTV